MRRQQSLRCLEGGSVGDHIVQQYDPGGKRIEQAKRSDHRPAIDDLVASMTVNLGLLDPLPTGVILLDDVITNGTTFKAAQQLLAPHLQGRKLVGLFLARRVFPPIEWPDI